MKNKAKFNVSYVSPFNNEIQNTKISVSLEDGETIEDAKKKACDHFIKKSLLVKEINEITE